MDLKLPPLGEGVDSGNVVSVLVREGDQISKGQGIIELETGKAVLRCLRLRPARWPKSW